MGEKQSNVELPSNWDSTIAFLDKYVGSPISKFSRETAWPFILRAGPAMRSLVAVTSTVLNEFKDSTTQDCIVLNYQLERLHDTNAQLFYEELIPSLKKHFKTCYSVLKREIQTGEISDQVDNYLMASAGLMFMASVAKSVAPVLAEEYVVAKEYMIEGTSLAIVLLAVSAGTKSISKGIVSKKHKQETEKLETALQTWVSRHKSQLLASMDLIDQRTKLKKELEQKGSELEAALNQTALNSVANIKQQSSYLTIVPYVLQDIIMQGEKYAASPSSDLINVMSEILTPGFALYLLDPAVWQEDIGDLQGNHFSLDSFKFDAGELKVSAYFHSNGGYVRRELELENCKFYPCIGKLGDVEIPVGVYIKQRSQEKSMILLAGKNLNIVSR